MKPLLLTTYGSCLKTKDRALVLVNQDSGARTSWSASEFPYDSIIVENLGGFVTFPALRWLATNGIPLTALDFNGRVLASYLPDHLDTPRDRIHQFQAFLNPAARLEVARTILEAKIARAVPRNLGTLGALLLYEAHEADLYWRNLGVVRDYPNARDPVNACLNYAYGLLESRVRMSVHRHGLDPSIGFLHEPQNYKSAFVYDLQEPFRDLTTKVALTTKKELTSRDYADVFGHGLRLRPEGAHRLVRNFSRVFDDRQVDRFTSKIALRCGTLVPHWSPVERRETTRTAPRIEGRTAWLQSV